MSSPSMTGTVNCICQLLVVVLFSIMKKNLPIKLNIKNLIAGAYSDQKLFGQFYVVVIFKPGYQGGGILTGV